MSEEKKVETLEELGVHSPTEEEQGLMEIGKLLNWDPTNHTLFTIRNDGRVFVNKKLVELFAKYVSFTVTEALKETLKMIREKGPIVND